MRRLVWMRARFTCEYCRLHQSASVRLPFQIEHIISRKHGGGDNSENLALACNYCNLHKGSDLSALDPKSGELSRLYHPRLDVWADHFRVRRHRVHGRTPVGRATVHLLRMNEQNRVELRALSRE